MDNVIQLIEQELPKYEGLTKLEKRYGLLHLKDWVSKDGNLDMFIKKYEEKSLDIRPFLNRIGILEYA